MAYVKEAIENQRLGYEVLPQRKTKPVVIPEELTAVFKLKSELYTRFKTLTPGKQREYCDYIAVAKREATKQMRLEKITPMIIAGAELHDKYKNY